MYYFFFKDSQQPKLVSVGEVTTSFMAALKFRRKTMSTSDASEKSGEEKLVNRRFSEVPGLSGETKPPPVLARKNTFKRLSQSITTMFRIRRFTKDITKPKIQYENTYKLGPDAGNFFCTSKVDETVYDVMEKQLRGKIYDYMTAGDITRNLSAQIKNKVKDLNFPRYRIICQVLVVENKGEGFEAASSFLWNSKTDNHTCVTYKNDSLAAVAMIYGVFLD